MPLHTYHKTIKIKDARVHYALLKEQPHTTNTDPPTPTNKNLVRAVCGLSVAATTRDNTHLNPTVRSTRPPSRPLHTSRTMPGGLVGRDKGPVLSGPNSAPPRTPQPRRRPHRNVVETRTPRMIVSVPHIRHTPTPHPNRCERPGSHNPPPSQPAPRGPKTRGTRNDRTPESERPPESMEELSASAP
jgi:hypothetical protein